jgi:hypothetical protein
MPPLPALMSPEYKNKRSALTPAPPATQKKNMADNFFLFQVKESLAEHKHVHRQHGVQAKPPLKCYQNSMKGFKNSINFVLNEIYIGMKVCCCCLTPDVEWPKIWHYISFIHKLTFLVSPF